MSTDNMTTEVREFIAEKLAGGHTISVNWLTHEMVGQKSDIYGSDCDFYRLCAYGHLSRVIKQCIGKYQPTPDQDRQLVLDGFDHLQTGYPVERNGERMLVPTDQISDEELLARAAEYEEMARGCRQHAKEIRAYVKARQAAA
jgi:hypothetical protein